MMRHDKGSLPADAMRAESKPVVLSAQGIEHEVAPRISSRILKSCDRLLALPA